MIALVDIAETLTGCDLSQRPGLPDVQIAHVVSDSRLVTRHTLFVAVAGGTHDGHDYLPAAVAAGASAALGTLSPAELSARDIHLPTGFPYLQVTGGRRALAEASAALYGFPSRFLTVIGITGTDGKTTTCTLLESILVAATRTAQNPSGRVGVITTVGARVRGEEQETGFHVTTPDAPDVQRYLAQMRDAGCDYAIVESTSHGLAQERVASVDFDVAAVTNITHEHLDYHGTRDAYVQAKALLFRALYAGKDKGEIGKFAVLNGDDEGSFGVLQEAMAEEVSRHGNAISMRVYGLAADTAGRTPGRHGPGLDVVAEDVDFSPAHTGFTLRWRDGSQDGKVVIESDLIGQFNVHNMLCAASVALGLGIDPEKVRQGIAQMHGVTGRMERIDCGQPFLAVVDFAHSPVSLERALLTLRPLVTQEREGAGGRLIAVFGCAGLRDKQKRKLMGRASGRLADFTVITAEDPRTEDLSAINREIESGVQEYAGADRYRIIPDRAAAIEFAAQMAKPGDVVAAFGKGHERSMCFGTTEYPWSDQQAMTDALNAHQREGDTADAAP